MKCVVSFFSLSVAVSFMEEVRLSITGFYRGSFEPCLRKLTCSDVCPFASTNSNIDSSNEFGKTFGLDANMAFRSFIPLASKKASSYAEGSFCFRSS